MTTTFNYSQFITDYPEFATYSTQSNITNVFNNQAVVVGQVVSSLFTDDSEQYYWLCVVLAHILTCRMLGLSGRLSNVGQGSESASFDMNSPAWAQYWNKSVYGQEVYQCVQTYLSGGHYISNGEIPYLGNSMQGTYAVDWYQY